MAARTLRFNLRSTLAPPGTTRAEEASGLLSTPIQPTANATVPCAVRPAPPEARRAPLRLAPAVRPVYGTGLARLTSAKPGGYQALRDGDGSDDGDRPPRLPTPVYARPVCWVCALAVILVLAGGVAAMIGLLAHRRETPLTLARVAAKAAVAAAAPPAPASAHPWQRSGNVTRPSIVRAAAAARRRSPPPPHLPPPPSPPPAERAALLSVHARAGEVEIAVDVGSGVVAQLAV